MRTMCGVDIIVNINMSYNRLPGIESRIWTRPAHRDRYVDSIYGDNMHILS